MMKGSAVLTVVLSALACFAAACGGGDDDDAEADGDAGADGDGDSDADAGGDAGADADAGEPRAQGLALVTTGLGDEGRLYEVDLATREVTQLASWTDATIASRRIYVPPSGGSATGSVFLYGAEIVERYRAGSWSEPEVAWSAAPGRWLSGIEICDERLFVAPGYPLDPDSPSSAETLASYDPITGDPAGEIDLSTLLPGDRPLVVASLARVGLDLFVSLFRGGDGRPAEPDARLAAIDCSPGSTADVRTWDVDAETPLWAHDQVDPRLWVADGALRRELYVLSLEPGAQPLQGPYLADVLDADASINDLAILSSGGLAIAEHLYSGQGLSFAARGACVDQSDWSVRETEALACTSLRALAEVDGEVWALASSCPIAGSGSRIFRWRLDGCESLGTFEVDGFHASSMAVY